MAKKLTSYTKSHTRKLKTSSGTRTVRVKSHTNKINRTPRKK